MHTSLICTVLLAAVSSCDGDKQKVRYKISSDQGVPNRQLFECAVQHTDPDYGAVRIRYDGSGCESLPLSWYNDRISDSGYAYLVKTKERINYRPAKALFTYPEIDENSVNSQQVPIPGLLEPGWQVSAFWTMSGNIGVTRMQYDLLADGDWPVVMHGYVRGDIGEAYMVYSGNLGLMGQMFTNNTGYLPATGSMYKTTLMIHTHHLEMQINGTGLLNFTFVDPASSARTVRVGVYDIGDGLNLHGMEFINTL